MDYALSLHISMTFRCSFSLSSSSSHNEPLFLGHHGRPNQFLPRHSSFSRSVLTCSRRRSKPNSAITSNSKKKKMQNLLQNNVGEDDDLDEDAFEALFRQLEEDLKNDDPSAIDGDEEITEENLAVLERELEEALGDDELLRAFTFSADESDMEAEKEDVDKEEDEEEEEERPVELKNW